MNSLRSNLMAQFGNPHGPLGWLAGEIMRRRPSNRERNDRTLALLELRPGEVVLEVGFGPGLALEEAARRVAPGAVVGLERSELMLGAVRRRNRAALAAGSMELLLGGTEALAARPARFDKAFAINVCMFWADPVAELTALRRALKPGGLLVLALQPRKQGATSADALAAKTRMGLALQEAGFADVRTESIAMKPVDTACALGRAP